MPAAFIRGAARWGVLLIFSLCFAVPLPAQPRWSWPDHSKNLQVLPKDTDAGQLRATMQGFSHALGVRCTHCHAGEEGQSLATLDFASDENPNKDRARLMMRMLGGIRKQMGDFVSSAPERAEVQCFTCHRGTPRPLPLADILWNTYRANGADAAVTEYHALRARYYGRGAYDFGEESLNEAGYRALEAGDMAGAIALLSVNTEMFPESGNVWDSLAEAYLAQGDHARAAEYYRKSLELDPGNRNAKAKLEELDKSDGQD